MPKIAKVVGWIIFSLILVQIIYSKLKSTTDFLIGATSSGVGGYSLMYQQPNTEGWITPDTTNKWILAAWTDEGQRVTWFYNPSMIGKSENGLLKAWIKTMLEDTGSVRKHSIEEIARSRMDKEATIEKGS